jgi:hypothetical protein
MAPPVTMGNSATASAKDSPSILATVPDNNSPPVYARMVISCPLTSKDSDTKIAAFLDKCSEGIPDGRSFVTMIFESPGILVKGPKTEQALQKWEVAKKLFRRM